MRRPNPWFSALTAATFLLASPGTVLAAEFSMPGVMPQGDANAPQTSTLPGGGPSIHISPDAFKQLSPEQQQLVQQRMKQGPSAPPSSQTKTLDPSQEKPPEEPVEASAPQATSDTEELSSFEQELRQRPPEAVSLQLSHYGYDLFRGAPSTFAPVDDLPVPSDYVIVPGDEIIISAVSPRRSGDNSLTVNRDGTIFYPNIGTLSVAGMTYSRMVQFLTQKIKGGARDMQLSIRMGKLRSINVVLVGRVKKPGSYTVSSLTTLSNALIACGGPTKMGSLRDIQLKRGGKVVARFDLYDFLLKGGSDQDLRLQGGDVIFVPESGPQVAIAGNVKAPAIYELKGKTNLEEVFKLAGNITPMGFAQQIQIERFNQNTSQKILDVDLTKPGAARSTSIQDGDIVKVYALSKKLLNGVMLSGHVERPGKYEYRPDLRLKDVIKGENDLKPEAYLEFGLIERIMPPDSHIELIPFHLGKLLAGNAAENKPLQAGDKVNVYYRWEVQEPPTVRVTGAVHRPGQIRLTPKMTVKELIQLAGGLKDQADRSIAELTRVQVVDNKLESRRITINLAKAISGDTASNLVIEKNDYLLVKEVPEYKLYRTVTIQGEVAQPGTYTFRDGETLSEVIARAGGFTKRAYLKGSIFTRESVKKLQEERLQDFAKRLEADVYREANAGVAGALSAEAAKASQQALETKKAFLASMKDTKASGRMIVKVDELMHKQHSDVDVTLEEGDVLLVPPVINSISIIGQVYNPTAITYEQGLTVGQYLAKAGGPTDRADTRGIYVIKVDGSVITDKNFSTGWGPWRQGVTGAVLEPGDTIMVPENLAVDTTLRDTRDITQILFQLASSAAITWGILRK
ncbi:SLBB domain-containing protein [bacterium]|nr:SLBB domain-containing protein [bacterium]